MLPTRKSLANPHACLESEFDDHPGSKIPKGMNILVEGGGVVAGVAKHFHLTIQSNRYTPVI